MVNRKGWGELSPSYRRRLISHGITESHYEQGLSLQKARGHGATPERKGAYLSVAKRTGIREIIPDFDELDPQDQNTLARNWVKGFMSRAQGPIKNPNRKKGVRAVKGASDEQIIARMDFEEYVSTRESGMSADDWKRYRELYRMTFSAAA